MAVFVLLGTLVVAVVGCGSNVPPGPATLDFSGLTHKVGAYSVNPDSTEVQQQAQLGIDLVVGPATAAELSFQTALETSGMKLVDSTPKDMIYQATCPTGPASCREPDAQQMNDLRDQLTTHIKGHLSDTTAAYYILDDYRPGLASVLASVYPTMRQADPRRPMVCALALSIVPTNATELNVTHTIGNFRHTLQNYSPKWCDAVMIYSYAPAGSTPPSPGAPYDWAMSRTLPQALSALRAKGWQPSRSPLIGVPQTFGYWPGAHPWDASDPPQYQPAPSTTELTMQVVAFCRAGATAVVGYAWNDGAFGQRVTELYNSVPLQQGLLAGARQCQQDYWK